MRSDRKLLLVPAFLLLQPLAVHWIAGRERLPAPPDLSSIPARIGAWQFTSDEPIAADVAAELGADRVLNRVYRDTRSNMFGGVLVAWFRSQRGGAHQPHSPKVCLPAAGWSPVSTGETDLQTAAGAIRVNRYVVTNGPLTATAMYWYETPRGAIASEWQAKFRVIADGIRDHRTDTALVRIFVASQRAENAATVREATDLAALMEPVLRRVLPQL
jgi:EpsI family protein